MACDGVRSSALFRDSSRPRPGAPPTVLQRPNRVSRAGISDSPWAQEYEAPLPEDQLPTQHQQPPHQKPPLQLPPSQPRQPQQRKPPPPKLTQQPPPTQEQPNAPTPAELGRAANSDI